MVNYFYTTDGNYTPRDRINTICNKNIESFINSSSTTTIEDTKKVINEISTKAQLLATQEIHTNVIKALEAQKQIIQALQALQIADIRRTKARQSDNTLRSPEAILAIAEADQVYRTLGKLHFAATAAAQKLQIIQSVQSSKLVQSIQSNQIEKIGQTSLTSYIQMNLMNNAREKAIKSEYPGEQPIVVVTAQEKALQEYQTLLATQITQSQTIQTTLEQITLVIQRQLLQLTETHTRVQSQIQTQLEEQTKAYSEILTQTQKYIPELESPLIKAQTLFVEAQTAHKLAIHALQKQILATEATQAAQKVNLLIITLSQKPISSETFLADMIQSLTIREIITTLQNKCFLAQKEATQIALFQSNESTQLKHSKQTSLAFQASQVTLSKSTFINDTSINALNRTPTKNLTEEKVESMRILQILEKAYLEQVQEAQTTQIALAQVVQETQKQVTLTRESLTYVTNAVQKQVTLTRESLTRESLTRESLTYATNAVQKQKQINDKSNLYLLYIGGGCVGFILFCILIYTVFTSNESNESNESSD